MHDEISLKDRWYLGDINTEDNWMFTYDKPINEVDFKELSVEIDKKGVALDFTETDAYNVLIVSEDFAEIFYNYMEFVQFIPVSVPESKKQYYVFVIKKLIDCVDEKKSEFKKFENGNEIRPDKIGDYKVIINLKIDPNKVNAPIFRLAKYEIELIVDESLKQKIENTNLHGIRFKLVS